MSGISTSRHHADWLSLIEVSGPFVSLPVLLKVFPQGLDPRDPAQAKVLRAAYEDWHDKPTFPGRQRAWVLHVLTGLLSYPPALIVENQALPAGLEANIAEMGETLRPDFALVSPAGSETAGQAQLLISSYPAEQALDRPVIGKHWKANPGTRMMELLHACGVALGLVTNGEHWMLVFAPRGETTGYASWFGALWLDEPITLRAFHSLLGVRRFFGVAADDTLLALLKESVQDQQEVTDQLGYQVREAVEVLVQAFDILDQDANRTLLKGVSEPALYEAALTVMMRLVFLFSAEERGLLHLGKPLYDENYAVSTLLEQLQEVADLHGPQVLERRCDAWARLLATFRAVHAGVHHQDLLIPAYGGSLFDPDRFPFLEGRGVGTNWVSEPAKPLAVNNRVALHLLTSLQRLRIKMPGGGPSESRRISFRALGVEQIGHVYEGLLDHVAERAHETVLGIEGTRKKEAEIPLATLEAKLAEGQDKLIELLKDETGRSASAIKRSLDIGNLGDEHKLLIACAHDEVLLQRIRPFAGVIREDSFERPFIVLPGCVYVTVGTARRSTGTHYTPPSLTQPVVQYTLEPLVYEGPAAGRPREQWLLKLPKEILNLKVCDMAMGSGAFLVQTCRYLAERLTEAWENEEKKHPGEILVTPEGDFSQGAPSDRLVPLDAAERLAIARRIVGDRCLYGVDINPMAVEMAKLSLWLVTLDAKRPFTFLDHAFKCGDSLLGLSSFEQLERFSLRPEGGKQIAFSTLNLWRHIEEAQKKREALEAVPSDTPEQITAKAALYSEAEEAVAKLGAAADLLAALEMKGLKGSTYEREREAAAAQMMVYWQQGVDDLRDHANDLLNGCRTLHWPLAFPEIMDRGGFDAFIGNPPFMGGQIITPTYGPEYRSYLIRHVASDKRGSADLCTYFVLRTTSLLRVGGSAGIITTNTISEGETRAVGLEQLQRQNVIIHRAVPLLPWPGTANLAVSLLWLSKDGWSGDVILDGKRVTAITTTLTAAESASQKPHRLERNVGTAFKGSSIQGIGFLLSQAEAREIIDQDAKYRDVLSPYLGGEDVTRTPTASPTRWAINFFDWSLHEAENYPVCLEIARRKVKPEREKAGLRNSIGARRAKFWWRYDAQAKPLYETIRDMPYVWVVAETSKYVAVVRAPSNIIFAHTVVVFAKNSYRFFAAVASTMHADWMESHSSSLETRLKYTLADGFGTFPFPPSALGGNDPSHNETDSSVLEKAGEVFHSHRTSVMVARQEGITGTYNRLHDPKEKSTDIERLRTLHRELDQAVATDYRWGDLDLGHAFHKTKQGLRYTISESAQREVLHRLLVLNHQRHAEEEAGKTAPLESSSKSNPKQGKKLKKGNTKVTSSLFA